LGQGRPGLANALGAGKVWAYHLSIPLRSGRSDLSHVLEAMQDWTCNAFGVGHA